MAALLLLLATAIPAEPPRESPSADEKKIAALVADLSARNDANSPDARKQYAAYKALLEIGPKARAFVPELIRILGEKDGRVDLVAEILGAIGPDAKAAAGALVKKCQPKDYDYVLDRIAVALVRIGDARPEATRALLLSSTKGGVTMLDSSEYLRLYPAKVVPHLIDLCGDRNARVRQRAVAVLGELHDRYPDPKVKPLIVRAGESGKAIPPLLQKLLADEDAYVRMSAAHAIARVAPDRAEATIPVVVAVMSDTKLAAKLPQVFPANEIFGPVPAPAARALIPLLDTDKDALRSWAINTLAALPLQAQLEDVLKNGKTARSRQGAANALGSHNLYANTSASGPALTAALQDAEFIVRFAAGDALVRLAGRTDGARAAAAAIPVLIEGLKHDDAAVRQQASRNLSVFGPAAQAAVPDLKRLLGEPKPEVALEAALALVRIAPADAADAVPVLVAAVKGGSEYGITRVAPALMALGGAAKSAIPELVRNFDAQSPRARLLAAEAAARIDPEQEEKATAVLLGLLKQYAGVGLRTEVLRVLSRIGPGARSALPLLCTEFEKKKTAAYRADLALALAAIDPDSANVGIVWIRKELARHGEDSFELASELRNLGPRAKPFIPEFRAMLKDQDATVRGSGIRALRAIGPEARAALPRLKEMARDDPQQALREQAADAVRTIEGK